jgi:hypothetical protein
MQGEAPEMEEPEEVETEEETWQQKK